MRSKVLLMQLRSVDKKLLTARYGSVSAQTMERVERALMIAAGIIAT
jgi:mRNA-degrading endonuclease toxin of MazEF toxin-antitoxin module